MASPNNGVTFGLLRSQLANRQFAPVYLLHGEEGYFIDVLVKDFENILPPEERDFNMYTMYAPQVSADDVMDVCRRYPMMSEYQVVILKECQSARADMLNKLHTYVLNPSTTTIFVMCYRGEQAKGKDLLAAMKKNGVMFESKSLKPRDIEPAIRDFVKERGLNIESKGLAMLSDFVGSDLSRLYNEIGKLVVALGPGATITPEAIERNIGVSKDYNNFELIKALSLKDMQRVYRIVDHFSRDPKNNPTSLTLSQVFKFFSNLLTLYFLKEKRDEAMMAELGLKWNMQLVDYKNGLRNYNAFKVIEIISAIREFDVHHKGIGSRQNEFDLMKDLMFRILTASGNIVI